MKYASIFKNEIVKYLLGTFLFTWIIWGLLIASSKGIIDSDIYKYHKLRTIIIGGSIPSIFAIFYVGMSGGKAGIKQLLGKILIWKINPLWYVFSIVYMYIIYYAPAAICNLFGNYYQLQLRYGPVYLFYLFLGQLYAGPLNEEFGWRGFVLPRLQRSFNPLTASIILGVIHVLWHLPLFLIYFTEPFNQYFIKVMCISVVYTWMYNHTKGSLLPILLLHANYNFLSVVFIMNTVQPTDLYFVLSNIFAILPIIFMAVHMLRFKYKKIVN